MDVLSLKFMDITKKCCSEHLFYKSNNKRAEEEQELEALVESLHKTCTRYKMEICAEKTRLMANSANGIQRER